jgi:hypothetical protein
MLKRTLQAMLIGYVFLGLATRALERMGVYPGCECDPLLVQTSRPEPVPMGIPTRAQGGGTAWLVPDRL